ncbi:MAG: hypothetical protein ACLP05_10735 [Candidatus Kryptoniota bacterium]
MAPVIYPDFINYLILAAYSSITIVVGYPSKEHMKSGEDFFLFSCSLPSRTKGLAILPSNQRALQVMGVLSPVVMVILDLIFR